MLLAADPSWWPCYLPNLSTLRGREKLVEFLLIGLIAEEFIKFSAGLHQVDHTALRTFVTDGMVHLQGSGVHGAVGGATVEHDVHAGRAQFRCRVERGLAKLRNVGQNGDAGRLL